MDVLTDTKSTDDVPTKTFLKEHFEAKLKIVQTELNLKIAELNIYIHSRLAEFTTEILTKIECADEIALPSNGHRASEFVEIKVESPPTSDVFDDHDSSTPGTDSTQPTQTTLDDALSMMFKAEAHPSTIILPPLVSVAATSSSRKRKRISNDECPPSDRTYKCDQCDWSFDKPSSLSRHKKTPHARVYKEEKKESFICDICPKVFHSKPSFKVHRNSHTAERFLTCDICSKMFTLKQSLRIHMRTHTDERPYMCQVCSKTFKQSSPFRRHMRSHNTEKEFKCTMCTRGFHEKIYLKGICKYILILYMDNLNMLIFVLRTYAGTH